MAKKIQKKRRVLVAKMSSGGVIAKRSNGNKLSSHGIAVLKHSPYTIGRDETVKIIKAVDKIYNQETSDIERLARIYSVKK
ncbi:hypothetical protein [Mucilaginibacter defluvii]|uniref:Uncharacterized protein n=1 Tax=Mucilaginibacter defluvii TaxID=1196019 RepID=A0ABP9G446_9SPHI